MKPADLYEDIVAYCRSNVNEAVTKKYSRYFKEGFDSYGLTQEILYSKADEIVVNPSVDFNLVRATSEILVKSPKYEETSFAIVLYRKFSDSFTRETFIDIGRWFETGIRNWASCDVISGDLMFNLLSRDIIGYKDLKPWLKAKNKFQRRAVPVSMIKLLKTTDDFSDFFRFIEPLMTDPEREVHQGVGWFLREAWKKRREQTEEFLLKWKDISPRLIFQYACEKMNSDEKGRFRKSKQPL
jgi:3-methyladenine DNA glycosylase AlkD